MAFAMACAIINGMKLHIDKSGRIVVPKTLRLRMGLTEGTLLEVTESSEGVLLRPITRRPSLVKKDGILVHTGKAPRGFDWERLNGELEQERMKDIAGL